jgi:uncharacterized protein with NRDE domain
MKLSEIILQNKDIYVQIIGELHKPFTNGFCANGLILNEIGYNIDIENVNDKIYNYLKETLTDDQIINISNNILEVVDNKYKKRVSAFINVYREAILGHTTVILRYIALLNDTQKLTFEQIAYKLEEVGL